MKSNFQRSQGGHGVPDFHNRDIDTPMGYQQLLHLYHEISKENAILKVIGEKSGREIRKLYGDFDPGVNEENIELYRAIKSETNPMLQKY